jgi:starch synthase (maltosyl-transferring)
VTGLLVVEDIRPRTPGCSHYAKAVVGERVRVTAVIFRDGHDPIAGRVLLRRENCDAEPGGGATEAANLGVVEYEAELLPLGNDEWEGFVVANGVGPHILQVEAWTVRHGSSDAVLDRESATDVTSSDPVRLWVDRERALFGAWYELFPRSYGGLRGALERLSAVADMGFDVVYLPPIHPIGVTFRKGPDNSLKAGPDDPGSPWAIGSAEGGHTSIHPDLGTVEDLVELVGEARANGMEVALDYALQCSPDHPWVSEHPEWFHHRPDGTIACAENPPKIYQDIYPLNFWPHEESDRLALWEACRNIFEHWISCGVRIFRVDNPHTKPIAFWEWVIASVKATHPEVIFLAEAFTRPKVMARLAEAGFTQSYTYFTWRTEQHGPEGLWAFFDDMAHGRAADYMRPNLWPNTPDILSGPLRDGPRTAFALRLVLAATSSPSYGVYSGYELFENQPASDSNEEYLHSEKYELRHRNFDLPGTLAPLMTSLNRIRKAHPALRRLKTLRMHPTTNREIVAYSKTSDDGADRVLTVVNLDPISPQEATVHLDPTLLGIDPDRPYEAFDELTGEAYRWWGTDPYVRLDPAIRVAHVLSLTQSELP